MRPVRIRRGSSDCNGQTPAELLCLSLLDSRVAADGLAIASITDCWYWKKEVILWAIGSSVLRGKAAECKYSTAWLVGDDGDGCEKSCRKAIVYWRRRINKGGGCGGGGGGWDGSVGGGKA
jgi:hypothetical protein